MSGELKHQYQLDELEFQKLSEHEKEVTTLAVDSEYLYSVDRNGDFFVWDKTDSKTIIVKHRFPVCEFSLESLCVDDDYIYTGGVYMDSKIWIWDKRNFREESVLSHHSNSILDMAIKDDALVCGCADGSLSIIETPNWDDPRILETDQKILQTVELDNEYIYAGGIGNKVSVFHKDNLKLITELKGHEANIFSLAQDKKYIYSGSGEISWGGPGSPRPTEFESAVRVWDKENWECITALEGNKDNVNGIFVDSKSVFSASDDGTLRIYSKEDWSQKVVVEIDQRINALTIDEDSIFLASGDYSIIQIKRDGF